MATGGFAYGSLRGGTGGAETPGGAAGADPIGTRYPMVDEAETPLPRQWSAKDKYTYLGLSQSHLRVHYKGVGKNHKDAASVRATHPIPAACGIFYFEVKVISKGREGYMGIGLSTVSVNLNRLPGWEKNSYGYHGDDGNSFCSSGTGQLYGPTFTTGDVIGCCVNLLDNSCFYTKNGVNLGIAFRNLPTTLYPTVGLQTPGEVVEANFGQSPFLFNVDDYTQEWRMKTRTSIEQFAVRNKNGEWQTALQKIVSTYLVHNGYCATAEAFAQCTGQPIEEELASIRNRQRIQSLVLSGRVGEAISLTQQLFPGLLESNSNLLFALKCRQFIEMVNGTDDTFSFSPLSSCTSRPPSHIASSAARSGSPPGSPHGSSPGAPMVIRTAPRQASPSRSKSKSRSPSSNGSAAPDAAMNTLNAALNGAAAHQNGAEAVQGGAARDFAMRGGAARGDETWSDDDMDTLEGGGGATNGATTSNGTTHVNGSLGSHRAMDHEADMETDQRAAPPGPPAPPQSTTRCRRLSTMSEAELTRILEFGRELHAMGRRLKRQLGPSEANKKTLKDAFSLLAYSDPWNSSVGHQLDPVQREPVCTSLNSAILELQGLPKRPPLELSIAHTRQCVRLMARAGIGATAFTSLPDYLH